MERVSTPPLGPPRKCYVGHNILNGLPPGFWRHFSLHMPVPNVGFPTVGSACVGDGSAESGGSVTQVRSAEDVGVSKDSAANTPGNLSTPSQAISVRESSSRRSPAHFFLGSGWEALPS